MNDGGRQPTYIIVDRDPFALASTDIDETAILYTVIGVSRPTVQGSCIFSGASSVVPTSRIPAVPAPPALV